MGCAAEAPGLPGFLPPEKWYTSIYLRHWLQFEERVGAFVYV